MTDYIPLLRNVYCSNPVLSIDNVVSTSESHMKQVIQGQHIVQWAHRRDANMQIDMFYSDPRPGE